MSTSLRIFRAVTVLFVALAATAIFLRGLKMALKGRPDPWLHGDWLINRDLVEIRRGPVGSLILDLSDLLSVSPILVTFTVQSILTFLLFGLLIRIFVALDQPLILSLFLLSPAFFVIFWLPYTYGLQRKEIIAFTAILLALAAVLSRSGPWLAVSAGLFVFGAYGHEANITLLPLYLALLWVCREAFLNPMILLASAGLALAGSLGALWYAVSHPAVSDAALVCQPLLDRGIGPTVCKGAILWLEKDVGYSLGKVQSLLSWKYVTPEDGPNTYALSVPLTLALLAILTLAPLLFALAHLTRKRLVWTVVLISALPMFPLYVVAIDWGRWLSMQVFSMTVVTMVLLHTGCTAVQQQPAPVAVAGFLLLSLLWVPYVTPDIIWLWYDKILGDIRELLG